MTDRIILLSLLKMVQNKLDHLILDDKLDDQLIYIYSNIGQFSAKVYHKKIEELHYIKLLGYNTTKPRKYPNVRELQ
ncbi:unnamed protein product [Dovyalis caffra]|uniref:Uncharacterized protein n=1 Tax=Dovyalis caffra TaxID=77055 RepID=A0AAV1SJN5_9ROSI|nr:unnamed protein product [Dovyalis caffra]